MDRRDFLRQASALAGAAWIRPTLAAPRERPNVLLAIADDWSWIHAGIAGDRLVATPHYDRVAASGVWCRQAFCSSPSCTPSRGALLTGQHFFRLRDGANLWSTLPADIPVYPDLLEAAGYRVGSARKGWGPGRHEPGGRARQPAGPPHPGFREFLAEQPADRPFCFWLGSGDPHRPYARGVTPARGRHLGEVTVPACLPDTPTVRNDIADYLFEVERFDRDLGAALDLLAERDQLANTLVLVTSDNGMPFPRAKTNLYDIGSRMPQAIAWPAAIPAGRTIDDLISHVDLAPTILEACGLEQEPAMTGRSLLSLLSRSGSGRLDPTRDAVILGRERHTNRRAGQVGYPMRALRTQEHLYVSNLMPDRWPAGDPPEYGDIDGGPTNREMLALREHPAVAALFDLAFGQRPAEELYRLADDPDQLRNVAGEPAEAAMLEALRARLDASLRDLADPRAVGGAEVFDTTPYYGGSAPTRPRV